MVIQRDLSTDTDFGRRHAGHVCLIQTIQPRRPTSDAEIDLALDSDLDRTARRAVAYLATLMQSGLTRKESLVLVGQWHDRFWQGTFQPGAANEYAASGDEHS